MAREPRLSHQDDRYRTSFVLDRVRRREITIKDVLALEAT